MAVTGQSLLTHHPPAARLTRKTSQREKYGKLHQQDQAVSGGHDVPAGQDPAGPGLHTGTHSPRDEGEAHWNIGRDGTRAFSRTVPLAS